MLTFIIINTQYSRTQEIAPFLSKLAHSVFSAVIVIRFFFYCMSINGPAKRSFLYGDEMNGSGNGLLSLGFLES